MYRNSASSTATPHRYSARRMEKPVNFVCETSGAQSVSIIGDFNGWTEGSHPMSRRPDGKWFASVPLHHGHHRYVFLVDGRWELDPSAQGIARNERNERVSLISVS